MIVPEPWPPDPDAAAERLTAVILDIDARDHNDRQPLLSDLLSVAWPTSWPQDQ